MNNFPTEADIVVSPWKFMKTFSSMIKNKVASYRHYVKAYSNFETRFSEPDCLNPERHYHYLNK